MENFFSLLERRVSECSSLLCIGLDPHESDLKDPSAASALDFSLALVRQTAPYAAAFKPNAAFFEVWGSQGWAALERVIEAVHEESRRLGSRIPVILDAKRGDIASTAEAYARSAFERLGVDAITLNPYLGRDSIEPFVRRPQKGAFLLCKTSNPGAKDVQDLTVDRGLWADEEPSIVHHPSSAGHRSPSLLYEHVAHLARQWNVNDNIGLVVGATHPEALTRVRAVAPELWFLSPGIGPQGGDLETALRCGLRSDGLGMLIAVSRSIARAEQPGAAAAALRDRIVRIQRDLRVHPV